MSNMDRFIRIIIALILLGLVQQQIIGGVLATVAVILAVIIVTTTIFGYCPMYSLFDFSTTKKKKAHKG